MTRDEIRAAVAAELGAIVDRDPPVLTDATTAAAVPGWDSLANLKLLVALEDALGVKFQVTEMSEANNVGELVDLIARKLPPA